jgi:hypothetical protein
MRRLLTLTALASNILPLDIESSVATSVPFRAKQISDQTGHVEGNRGLRRRATYFHIYATYVQAESCFSAAIDVVQGWRRALTSSSNFCKISHITNVIAAATLIKYEFEGQ